MAEPGPHHSSARFVPLLEAGLPLPAVAQLQIRRSGRFTPRLFCSFASRLEGCSDGNEAARRLCHVQSFCNQIVERGFFFCVVGPSTCSFTGNLSKIKTF